MTSSTSSAASPVCTCFMVRSLSRKISQLYDDTLAPSGLRGTQFSLLVQARNAPDGPPTVSALAEQLHTDRTTMTRNLRTLQQAGFIDLDDADVAAGVRLIEDLQLIAPGRASEILGAPVQPGERP